MCEQNIFKNCNILTYFSTLLELVNLLFFTYFLMKYISNLIPFYLFYKKILLYITSVFPELLLKFIFLLKMIHFTLF